MVPKKRTGGKSKLNLTHTRHRAGTVPPHDPTWPPAQKAELEAFKQFVREQMMAERMKAEEDLLAETAAVDLADAGAALK
ncbi:hypothetical protein HDU98_011161 [Podochytrium sp. JEL0797]|nr:hypothetical protein HDU98_011161 [Podochytrium sp. JEL0797]